MTLENNGPAKAYNFGVYLGKRYSGFANIVWQIGNDFQSWNGSGTDNNLVHQVMLGIANADHNHLQTIELNYNFSYSNQDTALSDVLSLDACYTYYETYDCFVQAYLSSPTLPLFLRRQITSSKTTQGPVVRSVERNVHRDQWVAVP